MPNLHEACKSGDLVAVRCLLESGADINGQDEEGDPPLHIAFRGYIRNKKKKCLHSAILEESFKMVIEYLLVNGSDVNKLNGSGQMALHLAASLGCVNSIGFLLRAGAELDSKDKNGRTCLHLSIKANEYTVMLYLLHLGCDIDVQDNDLCTPLHVAVNNAPFDICDILIHQGSNPMIVDKMGLSPFDYAVSAKISPICKLFFEQDTPPRDSYDLGTAVFLSVVGDDYVNFNSLLSNCCFADFYKLLKFRDSKGCSLLHLAALYSCPLIVERLLSIGSDVDTLDSKGRTPLYYLKQRLEQNDLLICNHVFEILLSYSIPKYIDVKILLQHFSFFSTRFSLLKYICKIKCAMPLIGQFKDTLIADENYRKECLYELEQMKVKKFMGFQVDSFLFMPMKALENAMLNPAVKNNFFEFFKVSFPIYSSLIVARCQIANLRASLTGPCLNVLMNQWNGALPVECITLILKYLQIEDLLTLNYLEL